MPPTDKKIAKMYVKFDVPSDRIVQNRSILQDFSLLVGLFGQNSMDSDLDQLGKRLINLRKAGKLPKIRKGRGPSKGHKSGT